MDVVQVHHVGLEGVEGAGKSLPHAVAAQGAPREVDFPAQPVLESDLGGCEQVLGAVDVVIVHCEDAHFMAARRQLVVQVDGHHLGAAARVVEFVYKQNSIAHY